MRRTNVARYSESARHMLCEFDDAFWKVLLARIEVGEVVPVVGPGAVTFGSDDQLLYPWLAQQLPAKLDLTFEKPPADLREIVDAQLASGLPVRSVHWHLHKIVEDPDLRPGVTLAALAAVEGFQLFISTTFDSLLPRAVESASPGGRTEERRGAYSLRGDRPDLPRELSEMQNPDQRYVYQILGRAKPQGDFVVWDDAMFRFLLHLNQNLHLLPKLSDALEKSDFLVLGLSFAEWLLHFFVQVVKNKALSELARRELFVFEKLEPAERAKAVVYFSRLTKQIRVLPNDPIEFISELHGRWRQKHPLPVGDPYLMTKAHRERQRALGCIFVSYAAPDLEIARYVVSQLQRAGLLVWFDKEQIEPGANWKETLREAVEERCGLFLSLISATTAQRLEGYNIFERNLAARRRDTFADNAVFYLPIRIDDQQPIIPDNEPRGVKAVQGQQKPGGHLDADFVGYLGEKQREYCNAKGIPVAPMNSV